MKIKRLLWPFIVLVIIGFVFVIYLNKKELSRGENNLSQKQINDELVIDYIKNNISSLSPEAEVLGGTFYVTNIEKIGDNVFYLEYEDGHIALSAELEYEINENGEIIIYNFNIIN